MCCSLEKGIVELRELEIAIHSTTQMSSQQVVTLVRKPEVNKLRDPTLI
jgi:hypothetical protein